MRTTLRVMALVLAASMAAPGDNPKPGRPVDVPAAFARLKSLAGEWEMNADQMKITVRFDLIAGGHSLVEHDAMGKMEAMMTVYYLDGDRLMLTHYCITGNQPRLQLRSFDAASGDLAFDFIDATNLPDSKAAHMHALSLHLVDAGHYTAEWQSYKDGKPSNTKIMNLTRVK